MRRRQRDAQTRAARRYRGRADCRDMDALLEQLPADVQGLVIVADDDWLDQTGDSPVHPLGRQYPYCDRVFVRRSVGSPFLDDGDFGCFEIEVFESSLN